ncbi:MAG: DNA polymerase IV, partial [Hyphomicrobiales bacterium]|nr:DNA polymerase IV [Hyphomicrobiales bacterium]
AGQLIRSMMDDLTPVVKAVSIDEAYLDMTGTGAVHGAYPAMALARFVQRVQREVGVSISVGLSYNPFLAKIASDLDKPNGFAVIGQAGVAEFLAPRSVGIIHGVGAVFQERLARDGIKTIGDLQRLDPAELGRRYGDEGLKLARLSRGEDHRAVTPNGESKSISAETTFETDISDPETLEQTLIALGERVAQRLRKADYAGSTITLKLKTPDFKQVTRSRALTAPTQLGHRISALGRELLAKEPKGRKYRLIGIGVTDLGPSDAADRGDLLDVTAPKEAALERTLDRLRDRFGAQSVKRAVLMPKQRRQIPQGAIPASKPEK